MNELETIVRWSKKIESTLENRFGAEGRGLHEKVSSIEHRLDDGLVKLLRRIATIRNKSVHEEDYVVEDIDRFVKDCDFAHNRILQAEASGHAFNVRMNHLSPSSLPSPPTTTPFLSNTHYQVASPSPMKGGAKVFFLREIVEMIAPVSWVLSLSRLIVEAVRLFFFALFFFLAGHLAIWMLTGFHATFLSVVVFVVLVAITARIGMSLFRNVVQGSKYNEYQ